MNSAMKPNFNLTFAEICIYGSRKQCMRPTEKTPNTGSFSAIQTQPQLLINNNSSSYVVDPYLF